MTCPDNLLIASRRGALSDDEQARLDGHLASCPTCRLTLRVGSDFDRVLETVPGDDLIAARFARNVGAQLEANLEPKLGVQSKERRGGARRYAWAMSIAILASGGLAAAATLGAWPFPRRDAEPTAPDVKSAPKPARKPSAQRAPAPTEPMPTIEAPAIDAPAPEAPVESRDARKPSAAELFAQANALRREGEPGRARGLYRQLQQLYPRSAEVEVAHVSLGRVHLELGEPRDALEQFERYLSRHPRGTLAEEALFGKASALERLGRGPAERSTWEALLRAYPSSVYAERAKDRLERLP